MTDLKKHFAVIGNPIHHSLSPQIHRAFAKEAGLHIDYEAILSPLNEFKNTIHQLIAQKLSGANVTLPFKKEAFQLATSHSSHARIAEAVNTLEFKDEFMDCIFKFIERRKNSFVFNMEPSFFSKRSMNLGR